VKASAEAHGRRASVVSTPELGTTFSIELPLDAQPFQEIDAQPFQET
jgi:signal transduction histidine kinase